MPAQFIGTWQRQKRINAPVNRLTHYDVQLIGPGKRNGEVSAKADSSRLHNVAAM
jgi:hypothetical protein